MEQEYKQNLIKLADHLDGGELSARFKMSMHACCALGHGIRLLEGKMGLRFDQEWVDGAALRLFGFTEGSDTGQFCFGSRWTNNTISTDDPHLAAVRLRYVAAHGSAPDRDQWDRFKYSARPHVAIPPTPVEELVEA